MNEELTKIIIENKNLIYSITHYFENYPNKDDLFQVGAIGLIEAYNKYDSSIGAKFTTYAYPYILGEMRKLVREDKGIKISRDISKLYLKIEKANIILSQKLMRYPTSSELSKYLDIPESYVIDAINSVSCLQSLDDTIKENFDLYDMVSKDDKIDKNDLIFLKEELNNLNDEDKKLIVYRYLEDNTQGEVAKKLGISQVQVSRYEQKVLSKLKTKMKC